MSEAAKPKREKRNFDWDAVYRDYRPNTLSLREVARLHGMSDKYLRMKAEEFKWQRDLKDEVKAAAASALLRNDSAVDSAPENPAERISDKEIVERSAAQVVEVVLGQRKMISRLKKVALALLEEVDEQTISRELYEELGVMLRSEDDKFQDKRNDLYNKLISGAGRVDSIKKLAETMKIIIGLERQAFNIGDEPPAAADSLSALLDHIKTTGSRLPIKPQGDKQ